LNAAHAGRRLSWGFAAFAIACTVAAWKSKEPEINPHAAVEEKFASHRIRAAG